MYQDLCSRKFTSLQDTWLDINRIKVKM